MIAAGEGTHNKVASTAGVLTAVGWSMHRSIDSKHRILAASSGHAGIKALLCSAGSSLGSLAFGFSLCIYIYVYIFICLYIYIYINVCFM